MKLYVAMCNNGEEREDNYEYVDAIFSTYEKAVEYIENSGFVEDKPSCWKQTWSIHEQEYDYWEAMNTCSLMNSSLTIPIKMISSKNLRKTVVKEL